MHTELRKALRFIGLMLVSVGILVAAMALLLLINTQV